MAGAEDFLNLVARHAAGGGTNGGTKKSLSLWAQRPYESCYSPLMKERSEQPNGDRRLCGRDAVRGSGRLFIYRQVLGRVKPKDPGASSRINRNVFSGELSLFGGFDIRSRKGTVDALPFRIGDLHPVSGQRL
jgi:hypothetical protein